MKFFKLGAKNKGQWGFTVVELLVTLAVTGLITGGITTTIFQVFNGSAYTSNHMIAIRQVQTAGYWISSDAQTAQTIMLAEEAVDYPDGTRFPISLTWTDWDSVAYQVVYSLADRLSGGLKDLKRSHYTDGALDETSVMAQYIDPDPTKTNCQLTAGAFNLPDIGDKFTLTSGAIADNGIITVTAGSISVITTGGAIYDAGTGIWTTPVGAGTLEVTADEADTEGIWTYTTEIVTATITTDSDGDAILTDGGVLILTITATVGAGSQQRSETRVYEVISRPS